MLCYSSNLKWRRSDKIRGVEYEDIDDQTFLEVQMMSSIVSLLSCLTSAHVVKCPVNEDGRFIDSACVGGRRVRYFNLQVLTYEHGWIGTWIPSTFWHLFDCECVDRPYETNDDPCFAEALRRFVETQISEENKHEQNS